MTTPAPLTEEEIQKLQGLLDGLPEPLQPLDASMLDGFLCAVLLQPKQPPESAWFPYVLDEEGRPPPKGTPVDAVRALVQRRAAELDAAIEDRDWFDPWVFELEDDSAPSDTVLPWVTGFAVACSLFPVLTELKNPALLEPLATLFMVLDPDDLEDADDLIAEIETLEPPQDLTEAVDNLVRSTLLLADVSRPLRERGAEKPRQGGAAKGGSQRGGSHAGRASPGPGGRPPAKPGAPRQGTARPGPAKPGAGKAPSAKTATAGAPAHGRLAPQGGGAAKGAAPKGAPKGPAPRNAASKGSGGKPPVPRKPQAK